MMPSLGYVWYGDNTWVHAAQANWRDVTQEVRKFYCRQGPSWKLQYNQFMMMVMMIWVIWSIDNCEILGLKMVLKFANLAFKLF